MRFLPGVSEDRVKAIAHKFSEYTGIEPGVTLDVNERDDGFSDMPCVIVDYGGEFELSYNYINYDSIMSVPVWEDFRKAVISHATEIDYVLLRCYYLEELDKGIAYDHASLVEKRVQQVEDILSGQDKQ
jgi:hypothetical protein